MSCSKSDDVGGGQSGDDMDMVDDSNGNSGNALDDAPDFSIETTSGETIRNTDFDGKNLVIFFLGAECPPCRGIAPDVEEMLYQKFKDDDKFAMIGGDQWNMNNAAVDDFVSATGVTFPIGTMAGNMARDFKSTYDRLVIVNIDGKIVFRGSNRVSNHLEQGIEVVKELLQ